MAGIIIAGIQSGTGKTTITMGLIRAFCMQNIRIACAKVGPDYIDSAFHTVASDNTCYNLDLWAMRPDTINGLIWTLEDTSDLHIIEGVMGLFDGTQGGIGSTAHMAKHTGYPIVLVVDCSRHSTSISAIIHGFDSLDKDIAIAGVILNRVGSQKHRAILLESLHTHVPHIPILGILPTLPHMTLPSRHLGLIQHCEHPTLDTFLQQTAHTITECVNISTLQKLARPATCTKAPFPHIPPLGTHIAISRDKGFQFIYAHIVHAWEQAGVNISYFSPLANQAPHPDANAIYICGGYPELHLPTLAKAHVFKNAIRQAVKNHIPVYGECGGYMVMGHSIIDTDGIPYPMIGVLDTITDFQNKTRTLSYQTFENMHTDTPLPMHSKGHSFHYATTHQASKAPLGMLTNTYTHTPQQSGARQGSAYGSFYHMIDIVE